MDKAIKVIKVETVDVTPVSTTHACAMPAEKVQLLPPRSEAELRTFIAEAIEGSADTFGMVRPGIHFVPDRASSDSTPTGRALIVRFGEHDFEVRVARSNASVEGI